MDQVFPFLLRLFFYRQNVFSSFSDRVLHAVKKCLWLSRNPLYKLVRKQGIRFIVQLLSINAVGRLLSGQPFVNSSAVRYWIFSFITTF